jgi:lysozyme family protein
MTVKKDEDIFNDMFNYVMTWEGRSFVDDKDDLGGRTKFGITQRWFPNLDIENLTEMEAAEIYYNHYFLPHVRLLTVSPDDPLSYQFKIELFDFIVNSGSKNAIKTFQKTLNSFSPIHIEVDGYYGKKTYSAWINLISEGFQSELLYTFRAYRACFYQRLADNNESQKKFLTGWLRRANANYVLF